MQGRGAQHGPIPEDVAAPATIGPQQNVVEALAEAMPQQGVPQHKLVGALAEAMQQGVPQQGAVQGGGTTGGRGISRLAE